MEVAVAIIALAFTVLYAIYNEIWKCKERRDVYREKNNREKVKEVLKLRSGNRVLLEEIVKETALSEDEVYAAIRVLDREGRIIDYGLTSSGRGWGLKPG